MKYFKFTRNENDKISNEALKGFIEELMIPDSISKIKDHLRTLGAEDFKSMSKRGLKKLNTSEQKVT